MLKIFSKFNLFRFTKKQSFELITSLETQSYRNITKTTFNLVNTFDSSIFDIVNDESKKIKIFTKEWENLITKAEKSVGYPTSFLNLRYLVSDEVANVASLLRKLMHTNHPIITTAKKLINEPNKYNQINGLIVLLVSKAAGLAYDKILSTEISDGIHQSQRHIAEICEIINMALIIHKGVVNYESYSDNERENMEYGNKIAILCGDYLLANACTQLSKLKNTEVVDIMSQVIADISESIFTKLDKTVNQTHLNKWYKQLYRSSSSLLANSCKASAILVNHSSETQSNIFNFAYNFDVTLKIWVELNQFKKGNSLLIEDSLLNAIYNDKSKEIETSIDDVFNDAINLFHKHYNESIKFLNLINMKKSKSKEEDAIKSLDSILGLMKTNLDLIHCK